MRRRRAARGDGASGGRGPAGVRRRRPRGAPQRRVLLGRHAHGDARGISRSARLCLLLGMDAFLGLPNWHRWRELLDLAHIVVAHRPGWKAPTRARSGRSWSIAAPAPSGSCTRSRAGRIYVHAVTQLEISSTELRQLIVAGRDPRYLVPDAVSGRSSARRGAMLARKRELSLGEPSSAAGEITLST